MSLLISKNKEIQYLMALQQENQQPQEILQVFKMDVVAIRDLVDILILIINNPTTLIKIYLMMMSINCVINIFVRAIYN